MALQLTLKIGLRDEATFANFYAENNLALLQCLKQLITNPNEHFIYLWGAAGAGKSHLLQACCQMLHEKKYPVAYFSLRDNSDLSPSMLTGLETINLVCIDDIDAVLGQPEWEMALFNFYNQARECGTRLIVAGSVAPLQLSCQLADLRSRLSWGLIFQVHPLREEQILLALQMRAENRGLQLSTEVGQFLLNHCPRNMADLFAILIKLDQASMRDKRRLTVPFVRQVLRI